MYKLSCFEGIYIILKWNWYSIAYMQTKAVELAGILEEKTIFYVRIETPNGQESIDEVTLERQQGIAYWVDGSRIIFTAGRPAMQANR